MPVSKQIQNIIKIVIAILAFGFIIWRLSQFDDIDKAWLLFTEKLDDSSKGLLFFFVFAGLSQWLIEVFKWRFLIQTCCTLSFRKAVVAVITGLTMAILTPNRLGEIFSRTLVLPKEKRAEGVALTGVNTFSLLINTQIFGLLGLAIYVYNKSSFLEQLSIYGKWPLVLAGFISILLIFGYFNLRWVQWIVRVTGFDSRFPGINSALGKLTGYDRSMALLFSASKYLTYTLQYTLLLIFMGVEGGVLNILPAVMGMFFVINYLPVITLGEAGIKGSIILIFLGQNPETDIAILIATMMIWMLNTALPALIGVVLLRRIRF